MKLKVGEVTYTGVKENSLAWYLWLGLQAIGWLVISLGIIAIMWVFVCATILLLG